MQIVDNKALRLRLRKPERVLDIIPKSAALETTEDHTEVLVHWSLDNARVLKNLGFKNVPSPIVGKYDWPGIYRPMAHQIITANFLVMHKRAYCLNEQGTMKTSSAAWAADYLMSIGEVKRVLVICPLSIMQTAWQDDIFRTAMHRSVGIVHGTRKQRVDVLNTDPEFAIINPDGIGTVVKELRAKNYDLIIIDEATCVKNANTNRWSLINSLIKADTWLWMLTGTPASQSPLDAYGLARMMNKETAPRSYTAWRDQTMYKVNTFKWVPKANSTEAVYDLLQPAIRFTKDQCLDLPPKTYTTRQVPMSKSQAKAYEQLKGELVVAAGGEQITAANAAAGLSKLLQVSSGSIYTDSGATLDLDISPRIKELCAIIEESPHKVIVFVPFVNSIERLKTDLTGRGYTVGVIRGSVSLKQRTKIINDFQNSPDPRIIIAQPQSVSHGITLHAADTSVWWGPVMSYETYAQANDRMHRKGQQNPCTVIHLQSSPVEQMRFEALRNKKMDSETLLEMYQKALGLI